MLVGFTSPVTPATLTGTNRMSNTGGVRTSTGKTPPEAGKTLLSSFHSSHLSFGSTVTRIPSPGTTRLPGTRRFHELPRDPSSTAVGTDEDGASSVQAATRVAPSKNSTYPSGRAELGSVATTKTRR